MLIMGLGSRWMMITRRTCAYDKINFPFNQVLDIQGQIHAALFKDESRNCFLAALKFPNKLIHTKKLT